MKRLMYGVVIVAALGFGLNMAVDSIWPSAQAEVTFDASAFQSEDVKIIGAKKTFIIPKGTMRPITFSLKEGTIDTQTEKKLLGLRKKVTETKGYIKDIEVGNLKASDATGLVEYINGVIEAVYQPTFVLKKGGGGLSVVQSVILGKNVLFNFDYVKASEWWKDWENREIEIKLGAKTSDRQDKILKYKFSDLKDKDFKLLLDMTGYRIDEFKEVKSTSYGGPNPIPEIDINALNEEINKMVAGKTFDVKVLLGKGAINIRFYWPNIGKK